MAPEIADPLLHTRRHALLWLGDDDDPRAAQLAAAFAGQTARAPDALDLDDATVYLIGDLAQLRDGALRAARRVVAVEGLARGDDRWETVTLGQVPRDVHGVGVFYPEFFPDPELFGRIEAEHTFQALTQSTKPGKAHRTGVYLTPVRRRSHALHFHLLRCSSNLRGPTQNFRATDRQIVRQLNQEAARVFADPAPLNHVLAQIYPNTPATASAKQTKAKIQAHADKTKDMPPHGIMAFCTFYTGLDRLKPLSDDPFDLGRGTVSGLTQLVFRLKSCVAERPDCTLTPQFRVTLSPGSVLFIPLSTNRLYTHEISPGALDAELLPTRMGYVVRCSSTEAMHRDGSTRLLGRDGVERALEPSTPDGMIALRELYAEENRTDAVIDYGERFRFSMNDGDYLQPEYDPKDEFSVYSLEGFDAAELLASVRWEEVREGRRGGILVNPAAERGVPIVRSTDRYQGAAQRFGAVHRRLARAVERRAGLGTAFNNAMIEHYTNAYRKMGAHSDMALDLAEGSSIALVSLYRDPEVAERAPRTLVVTSKEVEGETFEIPLRHGSVVVWSLETNRRFRHKIVLSGQPPENDWVGVTLRTSGTFIRHAEGATFEDGRPLAWVTDREDERAKTLYKLRGQENREVDFEWPRIDCTLSRHDTLPPEE